eukprot:403348829
MEARKISVPQNRNMNQIAQRQRYEEDKQESVIDSNIGGKAIKQDWLRNQSIEDYRSHLHLAFEKASLNYQKRQQNVSQQQNQQIQQHLKKYEDRNIFKSQEYQNLSQQYASIDPQIDQAFDKLKLSKLSRSCTKSMLERYFSIDQSSESIVYYTKQGDIKPKKKLSLEQCKITVESKEENKRDFKENKLTQWVEEDKQFRLEMRFKERNFHPVYYYTTSRHQALVLKTNIEQMLFSEKTQDLGQFVKLASQVFQLATISQILKIVLKIGGNIKKQKGLLKSLNQFSLHYNFETKEINQFIDKEIRRVKDIEFKEYQKQKAIEEQLERQRKRELELELAKLQSIEDEDDDKYNLDSESEKEEIKEPEKIPEIWSTFQKGAVKVSSQFYLKPYSKVQRKMRYLVWLLQVRRKQRHPVIQDLILNRLALKQILISNGQYRVHDQVLENMNKLGDIPYPISDLSSIDQIRVDQENLVLIDKKKHESLIPLNEIFYIATDIGYTNEAKGKNKQWRIQLRGRKINSNVEMISENILPSQIGLEKHYYSRLVEKKVLKINLKKTQIPLFIQDQFKSQIVNRLDKVLFRLKIEVGEFHCYSSLFSSSQFSNINLKDEITLDIHDSKLIKISLIAVKGRLPPHSQLINEFLNEQVVSYVSLRLKDFESEDNSIGEMIHNIEFNKQFYNPKDGPAKKVDTINLTAAIIQTQVNGAYQSVEMEGLELLVGRYAIYKKRIIAKILRVNRNFTCQIQLLDQQNNLNEFPKSVIDNVNARQDLSLIEKHGISILNILNLPQNYQNGQYEWSLDLQLQYNEHQLLKKIFEGIERSKIKTIYRQRFPQWVSAQNPHGETFDLGMFMKKFPHFILIEVYHQKKKSRFSSELVTELLGFAEVETEQLISFDDFGQEMYFYLEDSLNRSSMIKVRSLFVPSLGTIERLQLDTQKTLFKNAQQFMFFKVLHQQQLWDEYGYKVPLGKFLDDFTQDPSLFNIIFGEASNNTQLKYVPNQNQSIIQDVAQFSKKYERFSPEHKRHKQLQEVNQIRPKIEENVFTFKQIWLYNQYMNRNQALEERQRVFWEEFMNDLMKSPDETGNIDDEFKSIRSKLTNTTKMMSSKYRKRSRQLRSQNPQAAADKEESVKNGLTDPRGSKFSVMFVGQWEKEQSWKYVDIWYLIKFGIPKDLRVSLWKDLLRRTINETQMYAYFKKKQEYQEAYNGNISNYENLKVFSCMRDCMFYKQIEEDIKDFKFPDGYLKHQILFKQDRQEQERLCMYNIFKAFTLWGYEFCQRRQKIICYNKGMIAIVQRLLTIMNEEDAFWSLVGIVKAFNNLFIFDFKEPKEDMINQYQVYSPTISRRVLFKNEMNILTCLIQLHYSQIYEHLKSLSVPIDYYFYDSFTELFTSDFSSDIILRLWDMVVFNLSTNTVDNRKRALWYLLAVPLYMIQANMEGILKSSDPKQIKSLLINRTSSINYNPNLFIDELLTIIKQVFVKKDTMVNKLLKNDMAYQLENLRIDLELEANKRFKEKQEEHKKIVRHQFEKGIELDINQNQRDQNTQKAVEVNISLLSLRNVFKQQIDAEVIQIQVQLCLNDSPIQAAKFQIDAPLNNDSVVLLKLQKPINLSAQFKRVEAQKLYLQIQQIQNNIHQIDLGKVEINLDNYSSTQLIQVSSLKVVSQRLNNNQTPYIDAIVQVRQQLKDKSQLTIDGLLNEDIDMQQVKKDEEIFKQIKFELIENQIMMKMQNQDQINIQEMVVNNCVNQSLYQDKDQLIKLQSNQLMQQVYGFKNLVGSLNLDQSKSLSELLFKVLYNSKEMTAKQFMKQIFLIFADNNSKILSQNTFNLIIHHLYNSIYYCVPLNEIISLTNILLSNNYVGIVKVTQEQSVDQFMQNQGFFTKVFSKALPQLQIFDVTFAFKQILNSVVRLTGLIDELNLELEPFNKIDFWLRGNANNLKKEEQIIKVYYCLRNGDQIMFKYKVGGNGIINQIYEDTRSSILPLNLNGQQQVNQDDFIKLIDKLPLLNNVFRQDLLLRDQLFGSQEVYVDAVQTYKFTFQGLNNKKFLLYFNPKIDKQEDFTVDPSQLMRIAKGDVTQIYKILLDPLSQVPGEQVYQVMLSALSRQDVFITIKHRIKQILDFIGESENLRDYIPNILSEKFQFRKSASNFSSQSSFTYFNSMDRIGDVTTPQDLEFELVRVQQDIESSKLPVESQYSSFALYTHPSGHKQWRQCKIKMKVPINTKEIEGGSDMNFKYIVEYLHEKELKITHTYSREDVLLSFEYKKAQDYYYKEEIQEFLDKLDSEEINIAHALLEQDRKGMHGAAGADNDVKRQINFGGGQDKAEEEGLRIGNDALDEEKDEEMIEIRQLEKEDEEMEKLGNQAYQYKNNDLRKNSSSLFSGGI